jgi:hypothetical protein
MRVHQLLRVCPVNQREIVTLGPPSPVSIIYLGMFECNGSDKKDERKLAGSF